MIFISYRRADSESVVGRIYTELKKHFPTQQVFLDHDSIPLGMPFQEVIRQRLVDSKFALVLIGPIWHSIADQKTGLPRLDDPSDLVRLEVETALATPGVSVIPLWVMRATSSPLDIAALPESLRPMFDNNGMSIRPVPDEEGDIQRLIGRITAQLDKEQSDSIYFAGRSYYPKINAFYQETLSSQMHLQGDSTSMQRRQTERRKSSPPRDSHSIMGIDLGTTHSLAAICTDEGVRLAPNGYGYVSTPSAVYVNPDGKFITGEAAVSMILRDPQHGVLHVKRLFGRSQVLEAYGCKYGVPQLASEVIKALRADCERALGGVCNRAVVTIPAYFSQAQIDDVCQACDLAGLEVARLVAEPTAACMAAGDRFKRQETGEELCFETVAVFDLGGGTFDISIVETTWFDQDDEPARVFEILSVNGDCYLGGIDYDQAIIDYCLGQFYIKTGIALAGNATAAMRLRDAAERAKIELSTSEMATVFVPFIFANATGSYDMNVQISRSGFGSLTETLTSKIMEHCQQALADSRLEKVDYLLMIGLATRTPLIREKAEQLFGTKAVTFVDPDTAVALGAGIQASVLQGLCRETLLLDVIAHDICIETHGDCLSPIVGRNSTIPLERKHEFRTRHHNQSRIMISIWQGNRAPSSQNVLLSRFTFDQLTPRAESKSRFMLTVDIDMQHKIYVVVRDVASGRSARFNITEEPIFETIDPTELNCLEIEEDADD